MRGPPIQRLRSTRASESLRAVRHHRGSFRPADRDVDRRANDGTTCTLSDLAEGLVRLAGHEGPLPEALNFAGLEEHTLLDIATIAVEIVGRERRCEQACV